jgi:uncharacterized protein
VLAITETSHGLALRVYVQPRSSRAAVAGHHDNALKIKLTAPPVGGAANRQCIQIMAKALDLPKSAVFITGGETSRFKRISIEPVHGAFTSEQLSTLKSRLQALAQAQE